MIMGRFVLVLLILAEILMVQAVLAVRSDGSELNPRKMMMRTGDDESHGPVGSNSIAEPPVSEEESSVAEAPKLEVKRQEKHHSSSDKSVAGGGVIIGGLITAVFAAVYCYIRVTRRRDADKH
uniref:Transmembrane protein n=1 Tax=Davidia involucrata TaxID=16924 RepID=A0A5B7BI76_DAVIN